MNVYDVLQTADLDTEEVIKRCIRNLRRVERRSAREWLELITATFSIFDPQPSFYTMLAVVCPDGICRIFAADSQYIDVNSYKKAARTIPDIPDLQDMTLQKLLGMEVSPSNVLDVGYATFAEAFLRALMPDVSPDVYWVPHCAPSAFEEELSSCLKRVLAQYNGDRLTKEVTDYGQG